MTYSFVWSGRFEFTFVADQAAQVGANETIAILLDDKPSVNRSYPVDSSCTLNGWTWRTHPGTRARGILGRIGGMMKFAGAPGRAKIGAHRDPPLKPGNFGRSSLCRSTRRSVRLFEAHGSANTTIGRTRPHITRSGRSPFRVTPSSCGASQTQRPQASRTRA
jgi:hypothetical protein